MQQVAWLLATYSACTSALRPAAYTPSRAPTKLAATTPSLGLYGDWEPSAGGSYVLEAADGPANAKGVVHFSKSFNLFVLHIRIAVLPPPSVRCYLAYKETL